MFIVYATLEGHPAGPAVEEFLRSRGGWFTIPACLLEAYSVLVKIYATDPAVARQVISEFAAGPLTVVPTDGDDTLAALPIAAAHGLDLTDALLLRVCDRLGVTHLATDDGRLSRVAETRGLTIEDPISPGLREATARWEEAHLPAKGLPRVLHAIGRWIALQSSEMAESFRNATGGHSHVP